MIARRRHCPRGGVSTAAMRDFFALQGRSHHSSSTKAFPRDSEICKSLIIKYAGVAELADAPDLGFQIRRFQSVPSRFKNKSISEAKTRFFMVGVAFTIDE